ncbi:lipid II:glycine glycyltransferase FemX [Patescibacteria group bacterium]
MIVREVYEDERQQYNNVVTHPLQSWEWGDFREKTGLKIIRIGTYDKKIIQNGLQISIHPLPKTNFNIGYLPKCVMLDEKLITALKRIGHENNLLFIKIEPNTKTGKEFFLKNGCVYGRPLFTKYTFQMDLSQNEDVLFNNLKPKTRYNVKVALKNKVTVVNDNSIKAFNEYLNLTFETTKRQKFYAHDKDYHINMWQTLRPTGISHLLKASYQGKTLVTWVVFVFNKVLYYPYGASSREHKNVMASNLMMWEAIKFGKKMGCHTFDLWGCLGPKPSRKDPWYGFHRFKEGYSPKLVEFIGTFDLVIDPKWYQLYNIADSLRWKYLKLKTLLPF